MTEQRPSWLQRNFTLGNILTIIAMLVAAWTVGSKWTQNAELVSAATTAKVNHIETDLNALRDASIPREVLTTKLDSITDQLNKIDKRLDRIETRK
jgi:hypothetical protein